MPKYQLTYERVTHYLHEVEAPNLEEANELFDKNLSSCIDEQETWNTTDIELVKEN
jgi:hypothetical protein